MTRAFQITTEGATTADGSFHVDPSIKDVRASGDRSNQVQIASPQRPDVVEVPGGAINTTQGEGSAHRSVNGQDMVTVDGVQMTAGEAKAHGLLDTSQEAPRDGAAEAEDGPQGDEPPVVTAADLGVSAEDWQLHGQDINDIGEALAAGGLDEADGLGSGPIKLIHSNREM